MTDNYQRIAVIGTSGSGKTTLAHTLAQQLDLPHTELDAIHWGPDWTPTPPEIMLARVAATLNGPRWVVDGNYSMVRDWIWPHADTLVWLNYSLPVILWRLWWRVWRRGLRRELLWDSNRESLYTHFFTRESLFLWVLNTYRQYRREYSQLFRQPEYAHLQVIELRSLRATRRWLAGLEAQSGTG